MTQFEWYVPADEGTHHYFQTLGRRVKNAAEHAAFEREFRDKWIGLALNGFNDDDVWAREAGAGFLRQRHGLGHRAPLRARHGDRRMAQIRQPAQSRHPDGRSMSISKTPRTAEPDCDGVLCDAPPDPVAVPVARAGAAPVQRAGRPLRRIRHRRARSPGVADASSPQGLAEIGVHPILQIHFMMAVSPAFGDRMRVTVVRRPAQGTLTWRRSSAPSPPRTS